jgi:hypothetical protein
MFIKDKKVHKEPFALSAEEMNLVGKQLINLISDGHRNDNLPQDSFTLLMNLRMRLLKSN